MNDIESFTETCFNVVEGFKKVNPLIFKTKAGAWPRSVEVCTEHGTVFTVRVMDDCSWSISFSNGGAWRETMSGTDASGLRDVGFTACKAAERAIRQMSNPFYVNRRRQLRMKLKEARS